MLVTGYYLGMMYLSGDDVVKDAKRAVELYQRACDAGDKKLGCNRLAEMYEKGQGMEKDAGHAAQLFKQACDAGLKGVWEDLKRLQQR